MKERVLWLVYNVLFAAGYLLMLPKFVWRMCRRGGYRRNFMQRFGVYSPDVRARLAAGNRIWIHGVSVGEVFVALQFIREFRRREPDAAFVLSTNTSTGHAMAGQRLDQRDVLVYFPCDLPVFVRRALGTLKPRALVLTESELWPNLVRQASDRGVPVILINGRISGSSFRGYRRIRPFMSRILARMRLLLVQTDADRDRLVTLGAGAPDVHVTGTAKYDATQSDGQAAQRGRGLLKAAGIGPDSVLLVGGSTWPGEEKALLEIFGRLREEIDGLRLVLVPRHAERRAEVEAELRACGLSYVKRTDTLENRAGDEPAQVLLVDTTGELMDVYACATLVFVGKSLTAHGGQNVIEPALFARPVVVGPHMQNFPVVVADFLEAQAMVQVSGQAELERVCRELLRDAARRDELGRRARELVESRRGATGKSVAMVADMLGRAKQPGLV